jgi:MFS family permease
MLRGVMIVSFLGLFTIPFWSYLSDRVGRRPLLGLSYISSALFVVLLFFPLLRITEPWAVILAMAIPGAILQPMSLAVSGSFYPERFADPRLRFSGVSLGRQLGTILGGGLMPTIAATLVGLAGGSLTWALTYFAAVCALALGAVISSRETAGEAWGQAETLISRP